MLSSSGTQDFNSRNKNFSFKSLIDYKKFGAVKLVS